MSHIIIYYVFPLVPVDDATVPELLPEGEATSATNWGGQGVDAVVGSSGANVLATPVARISFSFSSKVSNLVFNQALWSVIKIWIQHLQPTYICIDVPVPHEVVWFLFLEFQCAQQPMYICIQITVIFEGSKVHHKPPSVHCYWKLDSLIYHLPP